MSFVFVPSTVSSVSSAAVPIYEQIHQQALEASRRYKKEEAELIEIFERVERHKVYLHKNCKSLYRYGIDVLGLSEAVVYNFIAIMRKSKEVPALKLQIEEGNLTLSNARKIASVITHQNQEEWLKKGSVLSSRALQKEIAKIRPQIATPEKASYVTETRVKLELGLFEKDMMALRRAQDLVSQAKGKPASLEDTLIEMTALFLKQKDPVVKARRVIAKKGFAPIKNTQGGIKPVTLQFQSDGTQGVGPKNESTQNNDALNTNERAQKSKSSVQSKQRTPIPTHILHQVNLRDQRKCAYVHHENINGIIAGKNCGERRWIEIHHIKPISHGGTHNLENLVTLCSTHHDWIHRQ